MSTQDDTADIADFPYLTEDDISILHTIVSTAESDPTSSTHPLRAVFNAYYTVLADNDINPDNDKLYLRFLLRMRDGTQQQTTGQTESLVESFTTFLRRLGIHVVFDDEASTASGNARQVDRPNEPEISSEAPAERLRRQTLPRRSSFTNLQDTITNQRNEGPDSQNEGPPRPQSQNTLLENSRRRDPLYAESDVHVSRRPEQRVNEREAASGPSGLKQSTADAVSRSGLGDQAGPPRKAVVRVREDHSLSDFDRSIASDDASELDENQSRDLGSPSPKAPLPLEVQAKALRFHHRAARACKIFWQWHSRARNASSEHDLSYDKAIAHDCNILQRQAFDQWRSAFEDRKHEKETEHFFAILEKRADQARDLYLLSKAFTHWAQCTSDEILRTSAARRHILRTRYFNAWRDITVVNELKVRRQGLSKFVGIWRRKSVHVATLQDEAASFRENRLAENTYRDWFWNFCDRRAPGWYATKLKIKFFEKWRQLIHGLTIRGAWSVDFAHLHIIRKAVAVWRSRLADARRLEEDARVFRRRALAILAFQSLQRAVCFAPLCEQVELTIASRVARFALRRWASLARLSRSATRVDELRVMRNAWTCWNDKLRCQIVSRSIDDRVILQALYRWVIAERLALCERIREENVKSRMLKAWRSRTDAACSELGRAEYWVHSLRKRRICGRVLKIWKTRAATVVDENRRADKFRNNQLTRPSLNAWRAQSQNVLEMEREAILSRFFFLTTRWIKQWGDALILTKKARRREAYTAIRRSQKMKLVRTFLLKWHEATASIQDLQGHAQYLYEQRLIEMQTAVLYQWHQRSLDVASMDRDAQAYDRRNLLVIQLHTMSKRHDEIQRLTQSANEHFTVTIDLTARKALHRLNLQIFKIKRQRETAESFDARTRRKHQRLMLKHWCDRSKRPTSQGKALFSQTVQLPPGFLDDDDDDDAEVAGQLEGTTAAATTLDHSGSSFEEFAAGSLRPRPFTAAPTPAYLRTPSRRTTGKAARSRMPLGVAATPQTTQITPFMSRMRALYPTGLPRVARPDVGGRSGVARRVADIEEASPAGGAGR